MSPIEGLVKRDADELVRGRDVPFQEMWPSFLQTTCDELRLSKPNAAGELLFLAMPRLKQF